jgi:photosystem II stability/assembly factor-like uncharacterized protein
MKRLFLLTALVAATLLGEAQTTQPSREQRPALQQLADQFPLLPGQPAVQQLQSRTAQLPADAQRAAAVAEAQRRGMPVRSVLPDGRVTEVARFENGRLFYRISENLNAAQTISIDKVWPGGSAGLSLAGAGMTVGEWDGGAVRVSHQEFPGGAATQIDTPLSLSDHATHVAGTIVGRGTQPNAKGGAYQATLAAYDWNNDMNEMAAAANSGMLLSNHSYGLITGWAFGNWSGVNAWHWFGETADSLDRYFGMYSSESREWDVVANNAPNYLIVKSAGNDRGDGPATGETYYQWNGSAWVTSTTSRPRDGGAAGYDCISHASLSKNVLTVGAVNGIAGGYLQPSQVVMSSFSGWGPTDDGRIKPDVVAKGVSVTSSVATSNTAYSTYNGTSMATPSTTGGLVLLQQHYKALRNNQNMTASQLKALVIHTADEAGAQNGPDYVFGWGLVNIRKAADVITNVGNKHALLTGNLTNGSTWTYHVNSTGSEPIRATLVWNDPAGAAAPFVLNGTTAALVRDLDIRIIRNSDQAVFSPWVLNPANRTAAATTGDNTRDNVEQVLLLNPVAGGYTVRVTHKGTLATPQAFGLVISGMSNSAQVVFRVDLGNRTPSPAGVHIAGSFQGWNPSGTPMTRVGTTSVWTYTANLTVGDTVQYKFLNGNAWGTDEVISSGCNYPNSTNRFVVVPAQGITLPANEFGSCQPIGVSRVAVTFRVDMTGRTVSPNGVHLAGSFQGWNASASPMTRVGTTQVYTRTDTLSVGTAAEFKFINGNSWGYLDTVTNQWVDFSEQLPNNCIVGPNAPNRWFTVPSQALSLPVYRFGSCATNSSFLTVDFATGIPAGWSQSGTANGLADPDAVFEYRGPNTTPNANVGSRGAYNARGRIGSPTAANGFVIFDSDWRDNNGVVAAFGTGTAPSPHVVGLRSGDINTLGHNAVTLRFNQFFRKFEGPGASQTLTSTYLVFSRNGGQSWPDTVPINTNIATNLATDSFNVLTLPVGKYIGNSANARIQFLFNGNYYFWMLDDISVTSTPAHDLVMLNQTVENGNTGNFYGHLPLSQMDSLRFRARAYNAGADAQSGHGLRVQMFRNNTGVWTEFNSNGTALLQPADTVNVQVTNPPFVPTQLGSYRAAVEVTNFQTDVSPQNNRDTINFEITDSVFALDNGGFAASAIGTNTFVTGNADGIKLANRYVLTRAAQLSSAFVRFVNTSVAGGSVQFHLLPGNNLQTASPIVSSVIHTVTAAQIQNGLTLPFIGTAQQRTLQPGTYYLAIEMFSNSGASHMRVLDQLNVPVRDDASVVFLPSFNQWYTNGNAFLLRLNVQPAGPAQGVNVTFRVNMRKYPVNPAGVHLAGGFQGWNPSGNRMNLVDTVNKIYSLTFQVPANSSQEYKFINGNQWGFDEQNVLRGCGVDNGFGSFNRRIVVGSRDTLLPLVFFNSCATNLNELTIADIQYVPWYMLDSGWNKSLYTGDTVTVTGVATMDAARSVLSTAFRNTYVQMDSLNSFMHYPFSGINVRQLNLADTASFRTGNKVRFRGVVAEFGATNNNKHQETQIDVFTGAGVTVLSTTAALPPIPELELERFVTLDSNTFVFNPYGEGFEGSAVQFNNLEVVSATTFSGNRFDVVFRDRQGRTMTTRDVSSAMRSPIASNTDSTAALFFRAGQRYAFVRGVIGHTNVGTTGTGNFRLIPRTTADIGPRLQCWTDLFAQGNTSFCSGDSLVLETPLEAGATYQWKRNGVNINWSTTNRLVVFVDGDYSVQKTTATNCVSQSQNIWVEVTARPVAIINWNGPLHFAQNQAISAVLNASPESTLRLTSPNVFPSPYDLLFSAAQISGGWNLQPTNPSFNAQMVVVRDSSVADSLGCAGIANAAQLAGKVAVIYRGGCEFGQKALRAQQAGAIAVVIVNSFPNQVPPPPGPGSVGAQVSIPVVAVSAEQGAILAFAIRAGQNNLQYGPQFNANNTYEWLRDGQPLNSFGTSYTATQIGRYSLRIRGGQSCTSTSLYVPVSQSIFGQTPWQIQAVNAGGAVNKTMVSISVVDTQNVWALEDRNTSPTTPVQVYRTTNGGSSWTTLTIPNTGGMGAASISAVSATRAYVTLFGDSARQGIYLTNDGGASWTRQNSAWNNNGFPNVTRFSDQNNGISLGDPQGGSFEIYTTTNGGSSWARVPAANMPAPIDAFEAGLVDEVTVIGQTMYYPLVNGRILKSTNGGQNWTALVTPARGQLLVAFRDAMNGVLYGPENQAFYVTSDGGVNWQQAATPFLVGTPNDFQFIPGTSQPTLIVSGNFGTAFTTDYQNWQMIDGFFHQRVQFIAPNKGWSGGWTSANNSTGMFRWNSNFFQGGTPPPAGNGRITGNIRYDNSGSTPINNALVGIYSLPSMAMADSVRTNASGNFVSRPLPAGEYVVAAHTAKSWGGVNATDALLISRHFAGLATLNGIKLQAADVNASNSVNATDALQVSQRFVGTLTQTNNLNLLFRAGGTPLAAATSVHMHSGGGVAAPWVYNIGEWGNPATPGAMTRIDSVQWGFSMQPEAYYGAAANGPVPAGQKIAQIGIVFRASGPCGGFGGTTTPCPEVKDGAGNDIFLDTRVNPPFSTSWRAGARMSSTNGFAAGDWLFGTQNVMLNSGDSLNRVIAAICVGDVNGSYVPSATNREPARVGLVNADEIALSTSQFTDVLVKVQDSYTIGALSLVLELPQGVVLEDVQLVPQHPQGLSYRLDGNQLRISWYSLQALAMQAGEDLLRLRFAQGSLPAGNHGITIGGGSELANDQGAVIANAQLMIPQLVSTGANSLNERMTAVAYPNPFGNATRLRVNLPEAGALELVLRDVAGRPVLMLDLGRQEAGEQLLLLERAQLASGVYFATIKLQGAQEYVRVLRLIAE